MDQKFQQENQNIILKFREIWTPTHCVLSNEKKLTTFCAPISFAFKLFITTYMYIQNISMTKILCSKEHKFSNWNFLVKCTTKHCVLNTFKLLQNLCSSLRGLMLTNKLDRLIGKKKNYTSCKSVAWNIVTDLSGINILYFLLDKINPNKNQFQQMNAILAFISQNILQFSVGFFFPYLHGLL